MEKWGNVKANALYNPDPEKHPPPLNLDHDARSSQMQHWITLKYRDKAFMRAANAESSTGTTVQKSKQVDAVRTGAQTESLGRRSHSPTVMASPATPALTLSSSRSSHSSSSAVSLAPSDPASSVLTTPSTSQSSFASDGAASYRSKTAPLPDIVRTASPAPMPNYIATDAPYNPFNRQMTASAALPATNAQTTSFASRNPYALNTLPLYTSSQLTPTAYSSPQPGLQYSAQAYAPQQQPVNSSMSGVMSDLAGLSLASPLVHTPSVTPPTQTASMALSNPYTAKLRPAFTPQSSFGQSLASNMAAQGSPGISYTASSTVPAFLVTSNVAQPAPLASRNPYMTAGLQPYTTADPQTIPQQYMVQKPAAAPISWQHTNGQAGPAAYSAFGSYR